VTSGRLGLALAAALALGASGSNAQPGIAEIRQGVVSIGALRIFRVTQPGSYVLTGDLTAPDQVLYGDITGIEIADGVSDVEIDLNGFSIVGQGRNVGLGLGISGPNAANVRVRNGRIEGTGEDCVLLGPRAVLENVSVRDCGGDGIQCAAGCRVSEALAHNCVDNGIRVGEGSRVADSIVVDNQEHGVSSFGAAGVVVRRVIARNNGSGNDGYGISASGGASVIVENMTYQNGGALGGGEIQASVTSVVAGNNGDASCP
jgi:hypothetical protein